MPLKLKQHLQVVKGRVKNNLVLHTSICYNILGVIIMFYIIIMLLITLDQAIKFLVNNSLSYGQSIPVIRNIFHFTYVRNSGAGFGILQGYKELLIIVNIIIISILLIYRHKTGSDRYLDIAMALIIGGAIGNIIDRIRFSFVIDYLDFRIWPVFNLADSAVVIGVGILIIYLWRLEKDIQLEDDRDA